jgi:hypothetical protein
MKIKWITIIISCLLLISALAIQEAAAKIFINENWDSGDPPDNWPCKTTTDTIWNGWTSDAYYGPYPNAGLSTTQKVSGTRSFHQYREPGSTDACNLIYEAPDNPQKVYFRFFFYLTGNWAGTATNGSNPPQQDWLNHFWFWNTAYSGSGPRLNMWGRANYNTCVNDPAIDGDPWFQWMPEVNNDNWWSFNFCGSGSPDPQVANMARDIESWVCHEFMYDFTTPTAAVISWWRNDVFQNSMTHDATEGGEVEPFGQGYTGFRRVILSGYNNNNFNTLPQDFYIDDIIVADAPVGCVPDTCIGHAVTIQEQPDYYATSISAAYGEAETGQTILIQKILFGEDLNLDKDIVITLKGGYNCAFSSNTTYSAISGKVTIGGAGKVTVENLIFK